MKKLFTYIATTIVCYVLASLFSAYDILSVSFGLAGGLFLILSIWAIIKLIVGKFKKDEKPLV